MTTAAERVACALVREWTRVYTAGLPLTRRHARRAEIESDLWEYCHDPAMPPGGVKAAHILARLVLGVPDDLHWRATQSRAPRAVTVAVGATIVALIAASWTYSEYLASQSLPAPPPSPLGFVSGRPPPPPPPPRPPGM